VKFKDLGWKTHGIVAGSSILSAYLAKRLHNAWHQSFGTGLGSILGITAILTLVAVLGYDLWLWLSDATFDKAVYYLSGASIAGLHLLAHYTQAGFIFAGQTVFWTFLVGTAIQYYLSR